MRQVENRPIFLFTLNMVNHRTLQCCIPKRILWVDCLLFGVVDGFVASWDVICIIMFCKDHVFIA